MHEKFPPEALQGCSFEEFVEQYVRFREWLRGVSRSHVGREFRTLVRVRLDVLDDTAAAGAKDSAAAAAGAKSTLGEPGRHQGGHGLHAYPKRRGHGHICNAWPVLCA